MRNVLPSQMQHLWAEHLKFEVFQKVFKYTLVQFEALNKAISEKWAYMLSKFRQTVPEIDKT